MAWYKQGKEGEEQAEEEDKNRPTGDGDPKRYRFWLAPGKNTKVTFLDGEGFFFREHQYYKNGSWLNWETCISDIGEDEECPPCEEGNKYSYVAAFTVIDHTKFKTRRGAEVTARKRLIVFKSTARNKVLKQKERREGNLKGCMFELSRFTDKECSTGEDFEFLERIDVEELKTLAPEGANAEETKKKAEDFVKPFDYAEIFKPKSAAELRVALGVAAPVGSEDQVQGEKKEEAVSPFDKGKRKKLADLV